MSSHLCHGTFTAYGCTGPKGCLHKMRELGCTWTLISPHYKLAVGYVQRISLIMRVPQPEGMTLPTSIQDPNANAMYKSLLFRPFHAAPMIKAIGETPYPFLCLHAAVDAEERDPYLTFSTQWQRYWREVVVPTAHRARDKLQKRNERESFWESKEVVVALLELSKQRWPFGRCK